MQLLLLQARSLNHKQVLQIRLQNGLYGTAFMSEGTRDKQHPPFHNLRTGSANLYVKIQPSPPTLGRNTWSMPAAPLPCDFHAAECNIRVVSVNADLLKRGQTRTSEQGSQGKSLSCSAEPCTGSLEQAQAGFSTPQDSARSEKPSLFMLSV